MGLLARRNLFHDKVRFAVTLTGIVFALVLIIIQFGLFLGFTRRRGLAERNVISRDEAEYEQAAQHFALIDAEAREEDRAHAQAAVATARAQLAEARAFLEKSTIRAPINGVILRKLRHGGESVSTQFDSPVITMADDSVLRVRLDVDESDVSKLRVGQRAYVTAEAYGTHKFWGHVIRVGRILGKKNVRTDEPSEHVDTKILETLVELEPGQQLPLGLRVDSFVESGERSEPE